MEGTLLQTCVSPQHIDSEALEEDIQQLVFEKAIQVILMHKQVLRPLSGIISIVFKCLIFNVTENLTQKISQCKALKV